MATRYIRRWTLGCAVATGVIIWYSTHRLVKETSHSLQVQSYHSDVSLASHPCITRQVGSIRLSNNNKNISCDNEPSSLASSTGDIESAPRNSNLYMADESKTVAIGEDDEGENASGDDEVEYEYEHERVVEHWVPLEYSTNFSWQDVDFRVRSSCGVDKCYWPSVSDASYGYLVAAESNYDIMRMAFDFGSKLEQACGIRHLNVPHEPAVLVNVTTELMGNLSSLVFNPSRYAVGEKSPWVYYKGDTCVVVQKVVAAPKPHLLYGRSGTKYKAMLQEVPAFQKQLQVSRSELRKRLLAEEKRLQCALRLSRKNYWVDFQGLIDVHGNFFHIDLDAHFWFDNREYSRDEELHGRAKCIHRFRAMIEDVGGVVNALSPSTTPAPR